MIRDLAVGFQKAKEKFPEILQDNYRLKEGLYLRLRLEQSWAEQAPEFEQNHVMIRKKEETVDSQDLLAWFKERDYLSLLLDMNKPLDPKKQVHSNNPFALFMKREVFLGEKEGGKYAPIDNVRRLLEAAAAEPVRQRWLDMLPKAGNRKKSFGETPERQFFAGTKYEAVLAYLAAAERRELLERINTWYEENLAGLIEFTGKQAFKNYVKLFFCFEPVTVELTEKAVYSFEADLYTVPKIFNSNDYNQLVAGELVGLPGFDMAMNSKKPFLEHKTMRTLVPDRVPIKETLLARQMTDWLAASKPVYTVNRIGYTSGFIPPTGMLPPEGAFHVYVDGKYNEVYGFENVPFPLSDSIKLEWQNILQLTDWDGDEKVYGTLCGTEAVQKAVSSKFFRGRLSGAFLFSEPDVRTDFTALMRALYLQSRQAFYDWLYKGTAISLKGNFGDITLRLLVEQLVHVEGTRLTDLADAFNLRASIQMAIEETGGVSMADRIQGIMDKLRGKLGEDTLAVCDTNDEFYFMAGQLAHYLVWQSQAQKLTGELFEPFLRANSGQQLKKQLAHTYMLYKHEVLLGYRKFNQGFSMVMGYEPEETDRDKVRELLLAGLFADNLFFEKTNKGEK